MIPKVLDDFPFGLDQPRQPADNQYIGILKNELITLKQEDGAL